jgi:hypothetical protein
MAYFDEVFADLQAKHTALFAVIAAHPEIADEVRVAWSARADEVVVDDPTDSARANALAAVLREAEAVVGVEPAEAAAEGK